MEDTTGHGMEESSLNSTNQHSGNSKATLDQYLSPNFQPMKNFPALSQPSTSSISQDSVFSNMESLSKRIIETNPDFWNNVKPVLADEETRDLVLTRAYASKVQSPKDLNRMIKFLEKNFSLSDYPHLKRIKKAENGAKNGFKREDNSSSLDASKTPEISILLFPENFVGGLDKLRKMEEANETVKQFHFEPELVDIPKYPVMFREDVPRWNEVWPTTFFTYQTSTRMPLSLSEEERLYLVCGILRLLKMPESKNVNCGLVVDPSTKMIMTSGYDHSTNQQPLQHASMCCIEQIAKLQRQSPKRPDSPYLCTGYDLFIKREPCLTCAMAILHSRFGRVIYLEKHPSFGGLGGHYKLHTEKSVNHRYEVYHVDIPLDYFYKILEEEEEEV